MYIDGVFSGGGIKGLALIGALQAVEEKGFVFRRVAGTSAGAILSSFIVAGYSSKELVSMLEELNADNLLDRRSRFIPFSLTKWLSLYWKMGLYKGDKLERWLYNKLKQRGIITFGDIPEHSLRIVASDLTNGRILVLPDDLPQYGIDPATFFISRAVRMSCSLPYFFEPVRLKSVSQTSLIVDGGVLSNFPIWLFDDERKPKVRPVLGINLITAEECEPEKKEIHNAIGLFGALFETMKDAHDARYISKRHAQNIIFIPVDQQGIIDFQLTEERKQQLVLLGKLRAEAFLQQWSY